MSTWSDRLLALGPVDLTALAILAVAWIRGLMIGFVWQFAGLVALVVGLSAASALAAPAAPLVRQVFPSLSEETNLDLISAYFLVFTVVALLVVLIGRLLQNLIDELRLSSFDRLLGGVFGVVKTAAFLIVLVSFLTLVLPQPWRSRVAGARTGQWSDWAIQKSGPLFPEPVKARVREMIHTLHEEEPAAPEIVAEPELPRSE